VTPFESRSGVGIAEPVSRASDRDTGDRAHATIERHGEHRGSGRGAPARLIRVFLVDDHALMREGLRAMLERRTSLEVVGEAGDGHEALRLIEDAAPDVVVMDIAMPGLNGIEVTRRLHARLPHVKILALSMYDDQEYASGVLRAGASGYILKDAVSSELADAIEVISRGEGYLCPIIARKLVDHFVRGPEGLTIAEPPDLTAREREVLQLVVEGCGNKETAERLGISPKTVEVHRARIASKLGIPDLPGLVRYAIRRGIIKP
jgi:DNA-binding NarL/FixJ family response regulator